MVEWVILVVIVGLVLVGGRFIRVPAALRASVSVGKSPNDVFAFVANPQNTPQWNPRVRSVTITDEPMRVGARYQLHLERGEIRVTLPYRVVAYEPGKLFAAETETATMSNRFEYSFASAGSGTRITGSSKARVPLLQALVIRVIGSGRTRRNLVAMKSAIESQPPSGHRQRLS